MAITIREGRFADSRAIARFICMAGGGLYEFLFDDLIPFVTAVDVITAGVAGGDFPVSHRHCRVVEDSDRGMIVAAANAFPADLLRHERYWMLPGDRQQHVAAMLEHQDWGSLFLNALAVDEGCRGAGVGSRLMDWVESTAREQGFDRVSLHVWADNAQARRLYAARGYCDIGIADVAPHPRLTHEGGSVLMRKRLAPA